MPEGKEYWVISWTKGIIYIAGKDCPYEIDKDKMFVKIKDDFDDEVYKIAVYNQIDNNIYTEEEIMIKDDTNVEFIQDERVVGFWKTIDFISNPNSFNPNELHFKNANFPLQKVTFTPDGEVYINYMGRDDVKQAKYTKNYIIDFSLPNTLSKYEYQVIDGATYLILEWKTGDYVYGGMINGYYVLMKMGD